MPNAQPAWRAAPPVNGQLAILYDPHPRGQGDFLRLGFIAPAPSAERAARARQLAIDPVRAAGALELKDHAAPLGYLRIDRIAKGLRARLIAAEGRHNSSRASHTDLMEQLPDGAEVELPRLAGELHALRGELDQLRADLKDVEPRLASAAPDALKVAISVFHRLAAKRKGDLEGESQSTLEDLAAGRVPVQQALHKLADLGAALQLLNPDAWGVSHPPVPSTMAREYLRGLAAPQQATPAGEVVR